MNNKQCGFILGTWLAFFVAACGNEDDNAAGAPFAGCSKAQLESDRDASEVALAGPGVDPQSGALRPGSYTIATTYLALKPDKVTRALEFGGPVVESLFTMKGFVAFSTTGSSACATLRTLTVWQSEEDMLAFVTSPAHLRAMPELSDLSRGTNSTAVWEGNAQEATWERAADFLAQETSGDR